MEKKVFNPYEWLSLDEGAKRRGSEEAMKDEGARERKGEEAVLEVDVERDRERVEKIVTAIEAGKIDITTSYSDWRDIGFAFAHGFGESGRAFFHRISSCYPDYKPAECDAQYTSCLRSGGGGITLATFFFHVKNAGIDLMDYDDVPREKMAVLPDVIFNSLPDILHKMVAVASTPEERDVLLLGSITAISACLPGVHGYYDGRRVYSNLFLFVVALASAGKGFLVHCKRLVIGVHHHMRELARRSRQQYETELATYNAKNKNENMEKPARPPETMLLIPANNSTTGVFQLLHDSHGKGLIFETEGDTLTQAFKSDYGNYSDGFRKAFHHETISYYRRTDREYVDIESPCLSTVLSGTPAQIHSLIPGAENGLFSRFMFYNMNMRPDWKDVFAAFNDSGMEDYFDNLGSDFYKLYRVLSESAAIRFRLTSSQKEQFNAFFSSMQERYLFLQGIDYIATVRRLGLITFRICMIFTALRIPEHAELPTVMYCRENDFSNALLMTRVLIDHSASVFGTLPEQAKPIAKKNRRLQFLTSLPDSFNRKSYLDVARKLSIPESTADKYISVLLKQGVCERREKDYYTRLKI